MLNEACSEEFITVLMIFSTSDGESTLDSRILTALSSDVAACQGLPDDEDTAYGQDD